jgi:hypothetical protein
MKLLILEQTHTLVFFSLLQKFIAKCLFEITRGDLGVKCGFSFVDIMKGVVKT